MRSVFSCGYVLSQTMKVSASRVQPHWPKARASVAGGCSSVLRYSRRPVCCAKRLGRAVKRTSPIATKSSSSRRGVVHTVHQGVVHTAHYLVHRVHGG